ncbi:MAG TPA: hypothetical protein VK426_10595 [Methanobacterium sp.]|nr:hypothetical protein [Methanobacterium sp.]
MLDLGIKKGRDRTQNYEIKYLNEIIPQEEISGEIYIGEMKHREVQKKEVDEFFVIITDHETQLKWICGFITSYYPETGTIYGEKSGRVYNFIDSLNHIINDSERDYEDSYSVDFETFRKSVNDNISHVTVKAVPSSKPTAKSVNLEVVSVQCKTGERLRPSNLTDIADEYPQFRMALINLKEKQERVNPESLRKEFKSMFDKKEIKKREYEHGLKEIEKWEKGG